MKEIDRDSNILEVIEQNLKERHVAYEPRQLVCDDRLRAAFILSDSKTIIDVGDQQLGYYKRTGDTERKLKLRGRVADELAKSFGFTGGYRVISLVEMDFAQDEQEFIN